ncbi:MAG: hypothetical protein JNM97_23425 [Rhodoferax sp.]|nr:hypothetical protein [Rhodoferax sp.]
MRTENTIRTRLGPLRRMQRVAQAGIAAALLAHVAPCLAQAAVTATTPISTVQIDGQNATFYVTSTQGWGAPGCPAAKHVYVREPVAAAERKSMLALVLTARAIGATLQFYGSCTDQDYFLAHYVILSGQ